jgi:hypothetical protein
VRARRGVRRARPSGRLADTLFSFSALFIFRLDEEVILLVEREGIAERSVERVEVDRRRRIIVGGSGGRSRRRGGRAAAARRRWHTEAWLGTDPLRVGIGVLSLGSHLRRKA